MSNSLNDFIHASAASMFEDSPNTPYIAHEDAIRGFVNYLIEHKETKNTISHGNWEISRIRTDNGAVRWTLTSRDVSYYDFDDHIQNLLTTH